MSLAVRRLLMSAPASRLARPLSIYGADIWHWHTGEPHVCHWDSIQWCGKLRAARSLPRIFPND